MPFTLSLTFNSIINESVQVGDIAYFTPLTTVGTSTVPFTQGFTSTVIELGQIIAILNPNLTTGPTATIHILDFLTLPVPPNPPNTPDPALLPTSLDFIMFGKDKSVNTTSLVGYYADVKFVNTSNEKVELFSVGSEIAESSK